MTQAQRTRLAQIERTPKAQLARLHVANGGQMGLPVYLKWTKNELVRIVAEDEGIDPWGIEPPIWVRQCEHHGCVITAQHRHGIA